MGGDGGCGLGLGAGAGWEFVPTWLVWMGLAGFGGAWDITVGLLPPKLKNVMVNKLTVASLKPIKKVQAAPKSNYAPRVRKHFFIIIK